VVDWFEQISLELVLLAEHSLEELEAAIETFSNGVASHGRSTELRPAASAEDRDTLSILEADHRWFSTSIDQLRWSLQIVQNEDHGGHRQALGQYGRIFAEAFRRHRATEARYQTAQPGRAVELGTSRPGSRY